jgi:hypothetical protein
MSVLLNAIPFLFFGLIVAFLVTLQVKHFVPFDFKQLRGNHPDLGRRPTQTVFDNTIACEDGSVVSSGPLAKVFAVVFAVALIALFAILVSIPAGSFIVKG